MTWPVTTVIGFLLLFMFSVPLRTQLLAGYPNDTIHHLSTAGSIGLIMITLSLSLGFIYGCHLKTRFLQRCIARTARTTRVFAALAIDIVTTVIVFWLCLTLVPALHYLYYQQLFDNLPNQWVVSRFLPLDALVDNLYTSSEGSLAQHSGAVLFFCVIFNSVSWAILTARHAHSTRL